MDTSKQGGTAGLFHVINLMASYTMSQIESNSDPCSVYFLNFTIDTIFGLLVCTGLLRVVQWSFQRWRALAFQSGDYGQPPRWKSWLYQLSVWLVVCLFVKCLILLVIWAFDAELEAAASFLLEPVSSDPKVELVFVVIVIPVILNATMFWVTDSFIKSRNRKKPAEEPLIDST